MIKLVLYSFICLLPACNNINSPKESSNKKDTIVAVTPPKDSVFKMPQARADRAKYHTDKDTVYIYTDSKDTMIYSGKEYNDIIDNFPELYETPVSSPDSTFAKSQVWVDLVDSLGNKNHLSFGSEAGQDGYYMLYAWFLKHKNGIAKFSLRRKKLLELYRTLNELHGMLNHGGTYFGHQYSRIEGYAEFSVYWFDHYEDYFDRPYNISKQKALYIAGLKQLITDEVEIDNEVPGPKDKAARKAELFKLAEQLNQLITDNFYLRMAKSFESDHY